MRRRLAMLDTMVSIIFPKEHHVEVDARAPHRPHWSKWSATFTAMCSV